jgi:precorrin-6B methylase 1
MSSDGIKGWLTTLMLDDKLMEIARNDVSLTFSGFDLTQDEKDFLISPETKPRPPGIEPLAAVIITAVRPQVLVRTPYTTFPKPVRPNLIAFVPESLRSVYSPNGINQTSYRNEELENSGIHNLVEEKASLAQRLIDDIFSQTESTNSKQLSTRRLLPQADITIVGLGMRSVDQLTREAERALIQANEVFLIDGSFGLKEYLSTKCVKVNDLCALYAEGKNRLSTYKEMAKAVVDGAIRNGPIAFGLYGHPTVFAFPPFVVKEVAESLGLTVDVIPGISSMDCIFAELMIDPANSGLQMFEATELLLTKRKLQTDIQTLIWQVGTLETGLYSTKSSSSQRYGKFLEYMEQFYPPGHPCTAIYCSDHPALPSTVLRFSLDRIGEFAEQLHGGFTLYLPPTSILPTLDSALERSLDSTAHLEQLTQERLKS